MRLERRCVALRSQVRVARTMSLQGRLCVVHEGLLVAPVHSAAAFVVRIAQREQRSRSVGWRSSRHIGDGGCTGRRLSVELSGEEGETRRRSAAALCVVR